MSDSWISDKVNEWKSVPQHVRKLITNPCGATPFVYIETAIPVIGDALLTLLSFGLSDVAIGYFHPKVRRGWSRHHKGEKDERRRGRDGEKRVRRGEKFPEIGNEIGKRAPGSEFVRGLELNRNAWWFWLPVDLLERGLYYMMIADVTSDSIIEWQTDIQSAACQKHPADAAWLFGTCERLRFANAFGLELYLGSLANYKGEYQGFDVSVPDNVSAINKDGVSGDWYIDSSAFAIRFGNPEGILNYWWTWTDLDGHHHEEHAITIHWHELEPIEVHIHRHFSRVRSIGLESHGDFVLINYQIQSSMFLEDWTT